VRLVGQQYSQARRAIGNKGNLAVISHGRGWFGLAKRDSLSGAIRASRVPVHLRFAFCNFSERSVSILASALLENHSFTGFTCLGNLERSEEVQLMKQAVVETTAPLQVWNNQKLTDEIMAARKERKRSPEERKQLQEEAREKAKIEAEKRQQEEQRIAEWHTATAAIRKMITDADISIDVARKYTENVMAQGFDDPSKLEKADVADLVACGLSRGDAKLLYISMNHEAQDAGGPDDVQRQIQQALKQKNKKYALFISYHQAGAAAEANAIYAFLLDHGFKPTDVFFDQVSLKDIRFLSQAVEDSLILLQLQSSELYFRPYTLLEAYTAFEKRIPIIPVALQSYDFQAAKAFLESPDFCKALDENNPGAVAEIRRNGRDPVKLGKAISEGFPSLVSSKYIASDGKRIREGYLFQLLDVIVERIGH